MQFFANGLGATKHWTFSTRSSAYRDGRRLLVSGGPVCERISVCSFDMIIMYIRMEDHQKEKEVCCLIK